MCNRTKRMALSDSLCSELKKCKEFKYNGVNLNGHVTNCFNVTIHDVSDSMGNSLDDSNWENGKSGIFSSILRFKTDIGDGGSMIGNYRIDNGTFEIKDYENEKFSLKIVNPIFVFDY